MNPHQPGCGGGGPGDGRAHRPLPRKRSPGGGGGPPFFWGLADQPDLADGRATGCEQIAVLASGAPGRAGPSPAPVPNPRRAEHGRLWPRPAAGGQWPLLNEHKAAVALSSDGLRCWHPLPSPPGQRRWLRPSMRVSCALGRNRRGCGGFRLWQEHPLAGRFGRPRCRVRGGAVRLHRQELRAFAWAGSFQAAGPAPDPDGVSGPIACLNPPWPVGEAVG